MNELDQHIERSSNFITKYSYNQLISWGVDQTWASYVNLFVLISITVILVFFVHYLAGKILRFLLYFFRSRDKFSFIEHLKNNRFPHFLALIAPVSLVRTSIPVVFDHFPQLIRPADTILDIYMIFMVIWILMSVMKSGAEMLEKDIRFMHRPIHSYLQVVQIILYLFGTVVLFSMLTGKSPATFFGVMGAASAVLLLMFKDTIMGFVASIQVTTNDMVRIGDWIEMPKYGADGDVIAMSLTTLKVQNWDKTITMVPTHTLISESFKNWRGMQEFGGRRIKRALIIKQASIRYLSDAELPEFKKISAIASYIEERKEEIDAHNVTLKQDRSYLVNGRNFTNLGLFRKYASWYIETHPGVHKEKTIMVRQLAPSPQGLPIEIYLFTNDIRWVEYEAIMADIFDHLIAAVPYFDLQIYEELSELAAGGKSHRFIMPSKQETAMSAT